jgi:hypothetical protein
MSYEERLKFLDMTTLETRRVRGDLIQVFKILKDMEDIKRNNSLLWKKGVRAVMNLNYLSLAVAWTVENKLFPIELFLICGIVCHRMLMFIRIVRGLYKSVMTSFPLPIGLPISYSLAQWLC